MSNKIIKISHIKNSKKRPMFFFTILSGVLIGVVLWHFFVENAAILDVKIPESKNISFNHLVPSPVTTAQIANIFEQSENKPILLYLYTTWCKTCSRYLPVINETIREFQNTDLRVITLSIDRNQDPQALQEYLNHFGPIYFEPRYLSFKEGFFEFLSKRNIAYNGRIPFTVLISRNGDVVAKFAGTKGKNYLHNKIVKEL